MPKPENAPVVEPKDEKPKIEKPADEVVTVSKADLSAAIAEQVRSALAEADAKRAESQIVRPADLANLAAARVAPDGMPKVPARVKRWQDKYDPETVEFCLSMSNPNRHKAFMTRQIVKEEMGIAGGMQRAPIYGDEGSADGNYLIPEEMIDMILTDRDELIELSKLVTVHNVTSSHGTIPQGGDVSVTWATEPTAFTESNPTFTEQTWQAYRVNAISTISRNLVDDAQIDVVAYVSHRLAVAHAEERDKMVKIGNNTNQPYGLYYLAGSDYAVGGALTYTAVVDGFSTLAARYRKNAVWVMNDLEWAKCLKLTDTTGAPIFRSDILQSGTPLRLLGKHVIINDHVPSGFMLFGDPKEYHLFDRQQLGVEMSTEGTVGAVNLFQSHAVGIKSWARYDGCLPSAMVGAWVRLTGIS